MSNKAALPALVLIILNFIFPTAAQQMESPTICAKLPSLGPGVSVEIGIVYQAARAQSCPSFRGEAKVPAPAMDLGDIIIRDAHGRLSTETMMLDSRFLDVRKKAALLAGVCALDRTVAERFAGLVRTSTTGTRAAEISTGDVLWF